MATNTIGSPSLITAHGYMDQLTAMGHKGTLLLLERGYKTLSWKDTDFHLDIMVACLVNDVTLYKPTKCLKFIEEQQTIKDPTRFFVLLSRECGTLGVKF